MGKAFCANLNTSLNRLEGELSNAFKSSAGFQCIITAAFMQLSRDVLQHCSAGGLDNFSDVVICSILSLRPELKSGEQICRLFNEVDVIWEQETGLAP